MPVKALFLILGICILMPPSAEGQWVPLIAKKRNLSYKLESDGSWKLTKAERGVYYRSSSGSVLEKRALVVNGKPEGEGFGLFTDSSTGKTYKVSFDSKKATLLHTAATPLLPHDYSNFRPDPSTYVGKQVVNGIECIGRKTKGMEGVSWHSLALDLPIKTEFHDLQWGARLVVEFYDFEVGVEPDASVFNLPKDFTYFAPEEPHETNK